MGNVDCRGFKLNDTYSSQELKLPGKISVKVNPLYPKSIQINGDHGQIEPETKRILTQTSSLRNIVYGGNTSSCIKKKKVKKSQNQLEQFMKQLKDDNNYSKKQMKKLSETSYCNTTSKQSRTIKQRQIFRQTEELEKMISQQQKFLENYKIYIDEDKTEKISQGQYSRYPLCNSKYQNNPTSSIHQSRAQKRPFSENPMEQCDTILKKQDEKIISSTQTSNLMNLIYHMEAANKSQYGKPPVILTDTNQIIRSPLNDQSFEQSFQIEIFIDNAPEKIIVKKGENINIIMEQFLQKHSLPLEIHQKLIQTILENIQAC